MRKLALIVAAIVVVGVIVTQLTYIPKSAASEFGVGAVECAASVGPSSANAKILEASGWKKRDSVSGADRFERSDLNVRLILGAGMAGCLTQGFAESDDQFPAIADAVSKALKEKYDNQFSDLSSTKANERNYRTGDLLHILSGKKVSDGFQIRVVSVWDQQRKP
jgi:hypothetical protein